MSHRIALIHATPLAMQPVMEAFQANWHEADTVNLLDDALSRDRARAGTLDAALFERIAALAAYATNMDVAGILFTCSAFGEAIEAVARHSTIPVLKPNEAMFAEALTFGQRLGLIATFAPAIPSLQPELLALAAACEQRVELHTAVAPGAMDALAAGDTATHDGLIAAAAAPLAHCAAVMLAQFSMASARPAVQQALSCPVLSSPDSAVRKLKTALANKR